MECECPGVYEQFLPVDEIRLIQIPMLAPAENQVLEFKLVTVSRKDKLNYVALSYAWPKLQNLVPVRINGLDCKISDTVEQALRQIYRRPIIQYVWIDQICINQEDKEEKSLQVQQMLNIYSKAESVIVWIGREFRNCDILFDHFKKAGAAAGDGNELEFKRLHEDGHHRNVLREAFEALAQRAYWSRLWIIQEFSVARNVNIFCGRLYVEAQLVREFLFHQDIPALVYDNEDPNGHLTRIVSTPRSTYVYNVFSRRGLTQVNLESREPFRVVLSTCLGLEGDYNEVFSTDARDRVFALVHLASDAKSFAHLIDYSKTFEEVYRETAEIFFSQGWVDCLAYSQFPKDRAEDLPSWVPDWSARVYTPSVLASWYTKFSAGIHTSAKQESSFPRPGFLLLHGVYVDTVEEVGEKWNPNWDEPVDKENALKYIDDIVRLCKKSPRVKSREEVLEATRIASLESPHWPPEGPEEDLGLYMNEFIWGYKKLQIQVSELKCERGPRRSFDDYNQERRGSSSRDSRTASQSTNRTSELVPNDWLLAELKAQQDRRCFITSTGFVGVGPLGLRENDEICIFYGGTTPYALRRGEGGTFTLVGDAYVHGIMFGEFLRNKPEDRAFVLR